jgi:putative nucleotidyltransferase with HDIG domain
VVSPEDLAAAPRLPLTNAMAPTALQHLALQEKTRREILHKSDLIPPLPDLVVRLLGVLNKQETEPRDLESLLQNDQVLVAKMLAMVNSPFYGLNRTIRTIKEAVMVLGFRGVRSLVLATSTAKFLQRNYECYGHQPKGLWLHAVAVAAGARALARHCRLPADDAEMVFVSGLLHDIGKMLLVPYVSEASKGKPPAVDIVAFERDSVGLDHAEAGALVTAKWNLAPEIQQAIRGNHGPASGNRAEALVRLADAIAHQRAIGYLDGRAPAAVPLPEDLLAAGLTAETFAPLRDVVAITMDEAIAALGSLTG